LGAFYEPFLGADFEGFSSSSQNPENIITISRNGCGNDLIKDIAFGNSGS
jgi:hypothetical protein